VERWCCPPWPGLRNRKLLEAGYRGETKFFYCFPLNVAFRHLCPICFENPILYVALLPGSPSILFFQSCFVYNLFLPVSFLFLPSSLKFQGQSSFPSPPFYKLNPPTICAARRRATLSHPPATRTDDQTPHRPHRGPPLFNRSCFLFDEISPPRWKVFFFVWTPQRVPFCS